MARSRLVRVALVTIVPLLLLELTLRVAGPRVPGVQTLLYYPKRIHRYDHARTLEQLLERSVLGFQPRTRCDDFVLNSRSFRTHEYTEQKHPGTVRILALGDSFTFALGLPHAKGWPTQLESRLRNRLDADVEVLNLGIPAVGSEFQHRLWDVEGAKLDPDLVVLAFPVGSNFHATNQGRRRRTASDHLAWWSCSYRILRNVHRLKGSRAEERLPDKWQAFKSLPQGVAGVPIADVLPGFRYRYDPNRPRMSQASFASLQQSYLRTCAGVGVGELFRYSAESLRRLQRDVVAAGAEFVVMICPTELQVRPEFLAGVVAASTLPGAPFTLDDVDVPQRFLRSVFEQEGIRYLDLLPAFRRTGERYGFYGPRDSHWNVMGHTLAANELAEFLTQPPESGAPWPWQRLLRLASSSPATLAEDEMLPTGGAPR